MEMERVLGVYPGYSLDLGGSEGVSLGEDDMEAVLASALDELEYCMGANSAFYGALRAIHGHPKPFPVNFVEIGNEDGFTGTYPRRFKYMYKGIKARYPEMIINSTTFDENHAYTVDLPKGIMYDLHDYRQPSFFLSERFNFFDNWQQVTNNSGVTILAGEYSVPQVDDTTGIVNFNFSDPAVDGLHVYDSSVLSAVAEAVYLIAMERNPYLVKMSTYAPSLGNMNVWNWKPDLITFDADPGHTVRSVSYYVQNLFNSYRGTHTLPVHNTKGDINPLFWVASVDEVSNSVYLKVVNTLNTTVPLHVEADTRFKSVNGTIVTDRNVSRFNYVGDWEAVVPMVVTLPADALSGNGSFRWEVPAFSITVLQFEV